jgi:ATP-binding cassette, sub-family E, member 1
MSKDIRIAIIDKDKCNPKSCNYLCKNLCPGVRMGEDTILISENNKLPIIDETLCSGCGICVNRCPQKAIKIIRIGIEFDKPIHQFDKNSFRLYSLPIIEKGFITGLIGRNGIGKTTALNILSGNLISNFGNYSSLENSIENTIEYFRGKNIQKHFEDLKYKKINVAYKIQKVEDIPKAFDKQIITLLQNINNNKNELDLIIKELQLEQIIYKTPNEISGGELQRVAIAATLLKNANVYFIDEYSTFLDIKQRFKIAKYLNKIISKNKSIILIEHDLAILDYLSDFVQIMYGSKNAYGACSNKKSTKKGINEFLEGFLKEENMRIRDYEISFASSKDKTIINKQEFIKFPNFEKKLGNFKLESNNGTVNCGEIIGIIGPNAIGKTTFIKLLSGELKPDNNINKSNYKISYKPQYIDLDDQKTVRDLFREKEINTELFESELRGPLNINDIIDQKIKELSGGELQKIAITYCLSKNADIYLIDEPSAFLDVELRLVISNTIKNIINKTGKCAFIVDHDLLFLDAISDRMLLFEGEEGVYGKANKITDVNSCFNKFLKTQDITFRQDQQTKRPRANKEGSQKDQEQKKENKYYYTL